MYDFLSMAEYYKAETIETRRHIHQWPEIGWNEFETQKYICSKLDEIGIEYNTCKTGIVAVIDTKKKGKTVVLRADIDALAVNEETDAEYKSKKEGFMHACGHDGHTSALLTAAKILYGIKDELKGKILFVFQPCEEELPSGAEAIVRSGLVDDADVFFGIHLRPDVPNGTINIEKGARMAASARLDIDIHSIGCHAGSPWDGSDSIVAASAIVMGIQTVVSRELPIEETAVISIGMLHSGSSRNVISDRATLTGTIRFYKDGQEKEIGEKITRIVKNIALAYNTKADVSVEFTGSGVVYNDEKFSETAKLSAAKIVGKENLVFVAKSGGNEDFSYYRAVAPSVFVFVGCKKEGYPDCGLHSPIFEIDESALSVSAAMHCQFAVDFLMDE